MTVYAIAVGRTPQDLAAAVSGLITGGLFPVGAMTINPINGYMFQAVSSVSSAEGIVSAEYIASLPTSDPGDGISLWNNGLVITKSKAK